VNTARRQHDLMPLILQAHREAETREEGRGNDEPHAAPWLRDARSARTRRASRLDSALFVLQVRYMSFSLGRLELSVLLAVARLGDDAYGLAVRRDVSARMGRDYSVGAVYTTLQRLEDKGLLRSRPTDPLPVRGGRSRRLFKLTAGGARAMREAERIAASVWAGIPSTIRLEHA
jgi:PadR family transcriptional regulator PadR